jgi:alpha-tubulin suppressor-like RCC1 family protein
VIQVVAGPRVASATDEGFALALTDAGEVYGWGKSSKGRLGLSTSDTIKSPRLVEALSGKDIIMIACCDNHGAAVTMGGALITFGFSDNGRLGRGESDTSTKPLEVVRFLASNQVDEIPNVKIGYVACGQTYTIAITQNGQQVFACGKGINGSLGLPALDRDTYTPLHLAHIDPLGPFTKAYCGKATALLTTDGKLCIFGKLADGDNVVTPQHVNFPDEPQDSTIIDVSMADQYIVCVTSAHNVYSWGKNTGSTIQLGYNVDGTQSTPKRITLLDNKGIKQVSAGLRHALSCTMSPPTRFTNVMSVPSGVPTDYTNLKGISPVAIYGRLQILNHISQTLLSSWRLFDSNHFHQNKQEIGAFYFNPLSTSLTRMLFSHNHVNMLMDTILSKTMNSSSHGPTVTIHRIHKE